MTQKLKSNLVKEISKTSQRMDKWGPVRKSIMIEASQQRANGYNESKSALGTTGKKNNDF